MKNTIRSAFALAVAALAAYSVNAANPTLTSTDVGVPSLAGSTTVTTDPGGGKVYTIIGGGNDIWGNADNFHYAFFKVSGNFDYVVKVRDLQGPDNWTKAELMAREDDGSGVPQGGDRHVSNMTTRSGGQNEVAIQWRGGRDGGSQWPPDVGMTYPLTRPAYPNTWLRLRREGSVFINLFSTNGIVWQQLTRYDSTNMTDGAFAQNLLLGLAVTAHNDADPTGATAVFSDFAPHVPIPVAITTQPAATVSIAANKPLELNVAATGDPVSYQWRKGAADIVGATEATYKIDLAQTGDSGTYSVRVYGDTNEVVSANSVVTVTVDNEPPTILSALPDESFVHVIVAYSEPVTATAENTASYGLDKGITVSSVARLSGGKVMLTTSKMAEGTDYTLTVNGVQDTASPANQIAANTKAQFKSFVFQKGVVMHKFWENVTQNNIAGFTSDPRFPDAPTWVSVEPRWEWPPNGGGEGGSNYGNQLVGWFTPATSGNYVFFTCSDDPSDLFLSTDENPANKKLIAQETGWSGSRNWISVGSGDTTTKRSDQFASTEWPSLNTITLQAGRRYYMESLHTEGGGGDDVGATFIMEGDAEPANGTAPALTGALIGAYVDPNGISVTFTQQPQNVLILENTTATFTVGVTSTWSAPLYQWQKAPSGGAFADIAGASAAAYTTPPLALAENGSRYRVVISAPGLTTNSAEAVVTISTDSVPPTLVSAIRSFADNTKITVVFSELMQAASANVAANYTINNSITVSAAALSADGKTVVLTTSAIAKGTANTLTVSGVKDLAGNSIAASSPMAIGFERGALFVVNSGDPPIINASDALIKSRLESKGYDVQAVGADLDDASMATGKDIVILSSTFSSGNVTDTYKDVPVPVIEWEQAIQDDMAMTTVGGSTDRGTTTGLTSIEIVDATHPMAAGLPAGVVTIATAASEFAWGQPNSNAAVIARLVGTANACIYGYDKGALLTDGTAAAERRVLFFTTDNVPAVMTDAGWKLFDAAVNWAQHIAVSQPTPQITSAKIAAGNITIMWSNGGTLQSTASLTPPVTWANETGSGSFTGPATGPAKFYRVIR